MHNKSISVLQSLVFLRTWDELLWKLFYFTNIAIRYPHQFGFSPEEFDTEMMHSFLQAKGSEVYMLTIDLSIIKL